MYDGAGKPIRPTIAEIKDVVARHNGVTVADLEAACRKRAFAWPRQIAQYLCREMTARSYPEIARKFGGRDHTSIIFAQRKVSALRQHSPDLDATLNVYAAEIHDIAAKRAVAEDAARLTPASPPLMLTKIVRQVSVTAQPGKSSPWSPLPPRKTKGQKRADIIDRARWMRLGGEIEDAA